MTRPDNFSQALRYAAPPAMAPGDDAFDAVDIVRLIRRRFWLIIAISAVIVALVLPMILGMRPTYTAGSRLLIQNPLTTALASSAEERMVELNLTTEVERLLSRDMAAKVIRALGIDARPEFNPLLQEPSWLDGIRARVRGMLATETPVDLGHELDSIDLVIPGYLASLRVAREPYSDVVRIDFTSEDPELAAAVPNTLLNVYTSEGEANLARNVQRADDWLSQRIAEQQARVDAALAVVANFEKSSGLTSGDGRTAALQTISTLTAVRTDLARQRSEITSRLADLDAARTPLEKVTLIDATWLTELSRDIRAKQLELDRLLRTKGNNHPDVAAARMAVDDLVAQRDSEVNRQVQLLRSKLAALDPQDAALAEQLTVAGATLARLDGLEARRDELKRIAGAEQAALERLEEQSRALTAEGKLPVADIEVLSPATPPLMSNGRGRLFYLVAACFAAGMVGLTTACGIELFDRSVRSFEQLRNVPGLTGAAMVPRVSRRVAGSVAGLVRRGSEGLFGEALLGIVLALRQAGGGRLPASVLVSSPLPGEGKSLIATALAVECVAGGQQVLLVDGDAAHGRLHRLFGAPEAPGFTDYLRGTAELDDVIRHDPESGIDYVARGSRQAGRMRDDDRIARLVEKAKASGRMLILDSAPVLASAQTVKLASQVEQRLLAMRWGRTTRNAVDQAVMQLHGGDFGDPVLGVITMVNPRRHALYGFKDAESFSRPLRRYTESRT